jgi:hypothetical protein
VLIVALVGLWQGVFYSTGLRPAYPQGPPRYAQDDIFKQRHQYIATAAG